MRRLDPVDKHIGSRLRMRRLMLRMSQEKLADRLGLTFQQVQKYEKGANRISASRLQVLSQILDVPVHFFYQGGPPAAGRAARNEETPIPDYVTDVLAHAEGHALMRAFARIEDPRIRRSIVHMVEAIGKPRGS